MQSLLHFKSFYIYNIFLIIIFCVIINSNYNFEIFYSASYCLLYFLLIYIGIYHYKKILYIIFFFYGIGLDIFLLNEIGPHLLTFMFALILLKLISKYLYNQSSIKIYFILLILELTMIIFVMIFSKLLYNFPLNLNYIIQIIILSFILSFPIFLFFAKIDKLK